MAKLNCWEYKKCQREPGGKKVNEFGVCPAAKTEQYEGINEGQKAGRSCWVSPGTFCGGKIQGSFKEKLENCKKCDFFQEVQKEEGSNFDEKANLMENITLKNKVSFKIGFPFSLVLSLFFVNLLLAFFSYKNSNLEIFNYNFIAQIGLFLFSLILFIFSMKYLKNRIYKIVEISHLAQNLYKGYFVNIPEDNKKDEIAFLNFYMNFLSNQLNHTTHQSNKLIKNLKLLPTPVMEIDKEFNVVFMNDTGAKILGLTPQDCIDKKCYDLFKANDCKTENCALHRAMKTGQQMSSETIAHINNMSIPIKYSGIPIFNEKNEITGALEFVQDSTDVYNLATKIKKAINFLNNTAFSLNTAVDSMQSSSVNLKEKSSLALSASSQINTSASNVASSSEEISTNIANVSTSIEEMSAGVNSVASAIEELNASFGEISKNTASASKVANNASEFSKSLETSVKSLTEVAGNIGKIVKIISEIADQTNMLALNATIEAASAGEAGKGFAVVASEVKELAKQTTDATSNIAEQINEIQNATKDASGKIKNIIDIIIKINDQNSAIAGAIEEQTATTREISQNVTEVAKVSGEISKNTEQGNVGVKEIAKSSAESSQGVKEILKSLEEISKTGDEVENNSENVHKLTGAIKNEIDSLDTLIGEFNLLNEILKESEQELEETKKIKVA